MSTIAGNKQEFAIEYSFSDDSRDTEIAMYVKDKNILAFESNGETLTTRWNLDELAMWLRSFIDDIKEDPFPVDCEGAFAAQKDDAARDFDSDDEELFESYYQRLYDWDHRHRWHHASSGAILADVFFQAVDDNIEISWDNRHIEDNVYFKSKSGGAIIPKELFVSTVKTFLTDYAIRWFS